MKDIDTLKRYLLQAQPDLSTARIDLLSRLLHGLLICRSVNLMKIATAMPGPTQKMSRYRRLQRFFSSSVSPQVLSQLIVRRLLPKNQPAVLTATMDRTHWVFGQTEENLLCLGLEFAGVSIPLESMSLGKAGNSNTEERKAIFARAWTYLQDHPCCLLADREFIGGAWFHYLLNRPKLDFVIRIKEDSWITLPNGDRFHLGLRVRRVPKGRTWTYENVRLYDQKKPVVVNLICHRSEEGELVLLVTNRTDLKEALDLYRRRWSIETAFSYLKSKGFDLEVTHLSLPDRIQLLLAVLALALLWCLLVGLEQHQRKPIPIKKHGRKAISLTRLGFDTLQEAILNMHLQWRDFRRYCRLLLSCT